ncbi:bifunctional tRNA (5-methylaminomethyl-2-thiouridine)(34)-methyltransferase MnmD/FAD-dependent 5-carboxymethylaminomethyl-2-thiouridine(34) oxidoreductase MnmC [Hyphococcus flavus]|uniref:tRNA 5-methylaminomethyl-2-thiouridine biosynthesis bifunctional protein MnmC n=1 Tax=Hyphococcus flavus TaxID=1866326 RepID=A0AAE9ZCB3_9PROT|nr:bifunctional tRNA (5-methylaminomethyl-2-thiouridine)(34)-methyltransferase MnmD/FAD-dependent 5-carboxymethylaminomethyl-2-thiouridine(34) oxidoreductase MnmC [Hyphococcus flavus]WDI30292.1 bifunctional tRNA (5-methylaminomethyl-2-thiouridine)(34)-methyltransferase MnmD/FAD-dependent 5-carboxymethylaminomethyl-2-thiouridine(34) oxidoreductase MnmC [Hyphococcus flavus]
MSSLRIDKAQVDWDASSDVPRSIFFDDVYFSGDGPAETAHVFLAGNDLPKRFETTTRFHIGELGFGTGLNILTAWQAWLKTQKPDSAKLHFLSVEAFPLSTAEMERAHKAWPLLAPLSKTLRAALPPPHLGFHHIALSNDVSLTLFYGDAFEGMANAEAKIDAWFLDGFAPSKNPAMWSPELFAELARLSKPNATFSTFTVAGAVRRALESAGFEWEKRPGHGRKREMLAGHIDKPPQNSKRAPWFATQTRTLKPSASIAVIGAGIAGASLAHELTRAGFHPSVYDASGPASGASGNPAGLIMPRLDLGDTAAGRFHTIAYLHTLGLLNELDSDSLFNPCGVLHHAANDKERERQEKLLAQPALPEGWIEKRDEGLFFPQGGVVDPVAFVYGLLGETTVIQERVLQISQQENAWRVITHESEQTFDAVVIANGLDALRFADARTLPLAGSAGQIDWFPDANALDHAHAFGPYAAPAPKGGVIIGATYAPVAIGAETRFTREATESNIAAVARTLPQLAVTLDPNASTPRASVRCTTPDRLPVVGPMPDWAFYGAAYDDLRLGKQKEYPEGQMRDGLFILTGLGSRGLVTAPLAAAMIAAEMTGAPSPVDLDIAQALHPARFFIRDYKRARSRIL